MPQLEPVTRLAAVARSLFAIAALAAAPVLSAAEPALKWDVKEQSFEAAYGQEEVVARYSFVNNSEDTVTITDTRSSCGCTIPSLEKRAYDPGESGELEAIFTIGSRQGKQHKTISVTTLEGGAEQKYELTLIVDIPVPVALKPRVRFWTVGQDPVPQEISILINEKSPMTISGVTRRDAEEPEAFDYEIVTVEPGKQYTLKATPKSMDAKARDVVLLTSPDDVNGTLADFPIYLYVR